MQFSKEVMKGVAEIIVLQTLEQNGESYGYQLIKSISHSSKNIFEFQEGTLYPLLYRLEAKGLISSAKKTAPNKKERRYYSITPTGKRALKQRTAELGSLVKGLKHVLSFSL
ncbi:MAG TPA: PadR family transcriptional regulator [Patescibacteria group bacterium]|nr:PadR family transcriptional regulator [Patescibacteria group bacterium]